MPQRRRYTKPFKEEALRLVGQEGCFGEAGKVQQGVETRSRLTMLPRVYSLVCMRNSFQKLLTNLSTKPGEDHFVPQQDWEIRYRNQVAPLGIPSEIVAAPKR